MASAKDLTIKPISASDARRVIKKIHYSGKVVQNSSLHFGVFINGKCEGAMQFGPSLDKGKMLGLVSKTGWNEFLELNRMAFSDALPRNSESRAIAIAFRLIRKHYPHIKWVVSFADGTQCGDGTIYRASGFVLTQVKTNTSMWENIETGEKRQDMQFFHTGSLHERKSGKWRKLLGYQLRYIYFIDKTAKERLTVPIIPFSKIEEMGAGMYLGKARVKQAIVSDQENSGGAAPTDTLHIKEERDGTSDN